MQLRPYQNQAVEAIFEHLREVKSTLIVMATGVGKTQTFGEVARRWPTGRILVLAHREELIYQARDRIAQITGQAPAVEMAQERADSAGGVTFLSHDDADGWLDQARIVVASVQSLGQPSRLRHYRPNDFGLVITDEAHHATAKSYRKIYDHFLQNPELRMLGVTATPDRADEEALGQVFESVAFQYEINDAIKDGWLVDVDQQSVVVEGLDFTACRTTAGDLNEGDLDAIMRQEKALHGVVDPTIEAAGDRPTLVFAVTVAHAERMAEIFCRHKEGSAFCLSAKTPREERSAFLRRFHRGEFQFLVNVGLFLEGFDEPRVSCVAMARPTKSRSLYCLDSQTEILTPYGWKGIRDEITTAAEFDLQTEEIRWSPVLARTEGLPPEGERMVELHLPAIDMRVTEGHDVVVRTRKGRSRSRTGWRKIKAAELVGHQDMVEVPIAGREAASGLPLSDDELRFIGWFLTDGTLNQRNGQIAISQGEHQPQLTELERCIAGCGFKTGRHVFPYRSQFKANSDKVVITVSKGRPRGRDKHLRGWSHLEPYIDKDLSPALDGLSDRQLGVLLEAIHLGDGHKQKGQSWTQRSYHIATGRKRFADRLQSLCVRRGWKCNASWEDRGHLGLNPICILHIKSQATASIRPRAKDGRATPYFSNPSPDERVWCVQTNAGSIVTRRNGKVLVLGNSQVVGRGTRPLPGCVSPLNYRDPGELELYAEMEADDRRERIACSGKPSVLVLDFVGNSGRHKLVSCADVLGGNCSDAVIEEARAAAVAKGARGEPVNIQQELAAAQKRAEEVERQRRKQVIARATFRQQKVDPFDVLDVTPSREPGYHKGKQPTDKMKQVLRGAGFDGVEEMSYHQAGELIGKVFERRTKGLCTFKQAKLLRKHGYDADVSFEEARRIIDALAANNWKRPAAG